MAEVEGETKSQTLFAELEGILNNEKNARINTKDENKGIVNTILIIVVAGELICFHHCVWFTHLSPLIPFAKSHSHQ